MEKWPLKDVGFDSDNKRIEGSVRKTKGRCVLCGEGDLTIFQVTVDSVYVNLSWHIGNSKGIETFGFCLDCLTRLR